MTLQRGEPRSGGRWRIAVVEDHLLQRLRTEDLLDSQRGLAVVHSSETLSEFVVWLRSRSATEKPHLLVLDLVVERGPNVDPDVVRALVRSGIRVLVLSAMASPPLVREILRCGVDGIVGKRDPESDIVAAAWSILGGRHWVTPDLASVIATDERRPKLSGQEERALVLYASGLTLDAVASALDVKVETARTYLNRVKSKYAEAGRPVRSKVDLSRVAAVDGYIDLSESEADASP